VSDDNKKPDESVEFDMYRFFSRWDVLLIAGVIVALLLWLVYHFLHTAAGV
jgi:hypothetical protein